jgi:hypothetical protein
MNDEIVNTIEVLAKKVTAKEEEANKYKRLVNELCEEAGLPPRYVNIADSGTTITSIRSDQFYGHTLTAAIRNYLDIRKSANLGAATVSEIYGAIRDGGLKFGTKNEENAKIVVANTLRKSSSIFHRLPNGQYGLLSWYPTAKAKVETEASNGKDASTGKAAKKIEPKESKNTITNNEIREIILAQTGDFGVAEIEEAVKQKYPTKEFPKDKASVVVFLLKKKGLLKVVSERAGSRPAVYAKS